MNNKEKYKALTKAVMFDLDEKVLADFEVFFEEHMKDLDSLKSINTDNVSPMVRVDSTPISFMREDIEGESLNKESLLSNAPQKEKGFVVLPKKGESHEE